MDPNAPNPNATAAIPAEAPQNAAPTVDEFEGKTVPELKAILTERGIPFAKNATRETVIELLRNGAAGADVAQDEPQEPEAQAETPDAPAAPEAPTPTPAPQKAETVPTVSPAEEAAALQALGQTRQLQPMELKRLVTLKLSLEPQEQIAIPSNKSDSFMTSTNREGKAVRVPAKKFVTCQAVTTYVPATGVPVAVPKSIADRWYANQDARDATAKSVRILADGTIPVLQTL